MVVVGPLHELLVLLYCRQRRAEVAMVRMAAAVSTVAAGAQRWETVGVVMVMVLLLVLLLLLLLLVPQQLLALLALLLMLSCSTWL